MGEPLQLVNRTLRTNVCPVMYSTKNMSIIKQINNPYKQQTQRHRLQQQQQQERGVFREGKDRSMELISKQLWMILNLKPSFYVFNKFSFSRKNFISTTFCKELKKAKNGNDDEKEKYKIGLVNFWTKMKQKIVFGTAAILHYSKKSPWCNVGLLYTPRNIYTPRILYIINEKDSNINVEKNSKENTIIPSPLEVNYPLIFCASERLFTYLCSVHTAEQNNYERKISLGRAVKDINMYNKYKTKYILSRPDIPTMIGKLIEDKYVVDVGCFLGAGVKHMLTYMNPRGVVGIDVSGLAIHAARKINKDFVLNKKASFVKGDVSNKYIQDLAIKCLNDDISHVHKPEKGIKYIPNKSNMSIHQNIGFDIAISVDFCGTLIDKNKCFFGISSMLREGGLFVFADKFEYMWSINNSYNQQEPKNQQERQQKQQQQKQIVQQQQQQVMQQLHEQMANTGLRIIFAQDIRDYVGGTLEEQRQKLRQQNNRGLFLRQQKKLSSLQQQICDQPYIHFIAIKHSY